MVLSLYTTREIQGHLEELYGTQVSPALISAFTDAVYSQTIVQLCIVHMVRRSLKFITWKDRKQVAQGLKAIYRAATVEEAELNRFVIEFEGRVPLP